MDAARAAHALAVASAHLVEDHDVLGSLAALFDSCREVLAVDSAAIVVAHGDRLELLAASSHSTAELEMHQAHIDEGPCIDAYHESTTIQIVSYEEIHRHWHVTGPFVTAAGFRAVHATPLRWHGSTIGAMGLFRRAARPFTDDEDVFARTFADIATLVITSIEGIDLESLHERVEHALASRVLVEQAKGVLVETQDLTMEEAYAHLTALAAQDGSILRRAAEQVVDGSVRRPRQPPPP